jgi:signal transduction histidine kinase
MAIFSAVILIVAALLIVTSQQIEKLDNQQDISDNIMQRGDELNIISSQYFLYQQTQLLTFWQSNLTAISGYLSSLISSNSEQQTLISNIRSDVAQLNASFAILVSFLETTSQNVSVRVLPEFQNDWNTIVTEHQTFALSVSQLSESLHRQADQLRIANTELMIAALGIFSAFFLTIYLIAYVVQKRLRQQAGSLERLVEERTKQLRDAERMAAIGQTAGMVGHDIRNPLQAITGDIYFAKTELASTPESDEKKNAIESLQEIEKNVDYINKIVTDLQDFAKPLMPKIEEIDLERIIHDVLANLTIPRNITVEYSIGEDFPKLKADQTYLQRILTNLANNAVQAMPNGGKLNITASNNNGRVTITVEDTGEGIPENVRSKLFTPLVTTKLTGHGFGLAAVKRFAEALGGTVTFKSEIGKGTKFTIELPV